MLNPQIIFEDDFLMAIDKPAGVVVNNAESVKDEETIQEWANRKILSNTNQPASPTRASPKASTRRELQRGEYYQILTNTNKKEEAPDFIKRSGIVHRLDRETSGVLLIAKNEAVFDMMSALFKARQVQKKYWALVHGEVESAGLLNFKIARHDKKGKFVVAEEGNARNFGRASPEAMPSAREAKPSYAERFGEAKEALTEYKLLKKFEFREDSLNDFLRKNFSRLGDKYDLRKYSLVEINLHTGRTHQIRVHFAHIHHPVVADALYGWRKVIKFERAWCPRHFLHAGKIEFEHPLTHKKIVVESELPKDLKEIMGKYLKELCF